MSDLPNQKTFAAFARPANRKIIEELEKQDAEIVLFPPIDAEEIEISQRFENLSDFDWLIFSDGRAVEFFLSAMEKREIDFFELDNLRVCAFGETTADALRFVQLHSDVISATASASEVFKVLRDYEPEFSNLRFLIPKELDRNLEIARYLTESGAAVTELPVYRALINPGYSLTKLKTFLLGGAIDEFVFTAPTDALDFSRLFPAEEISALLRGVKIKAIDAATLQTLREFGLTQALIFKSLNF